MNTITRCLGILCCATVVLLMASNSWAGTYTWKVTADTNWVTPANWTPGGGPPLATDDVLFPYTAQAGTTVTLPDGGTTVGNFTINTAWGGWTFADANATLNVSGNFSIKDRGEFTTAIAPVVNITGQLIGPMETWTDQPGGFPQDMEYVNFTNNGNTFGGGISIASNRYTISGNNNAFNGGITVLGDVGYFRPLSTWSGDYAGGAMFITGAGNTFGAGAFNLNSQGILDITQNSDFSAVTAVNFNGGYLQLGGTNTFSALAGGFNVPSGGLIVAGDGSLGSDANGVTLGGGNTFGYLMGKAANSAGNYLNRPITLSGLGGVFLTTSAVTTNGDTTGTYLSTGATIGGTGLLIKSGETELCFLSGTGANNYSGGTVVAGGWISAQPTSACVLGTGNVTVLPYGALDLSTTANMNAGASVLVVGGGLVNKGALYVGSDHALPAIDPASDGVVCVWQTFGNGSEAATALGNGIAGDGTNGYVFLGTAYWYSGSALAPGEPVTPGGNDTYRFTGMYDNYDTWVIGRNPSNNRLTITTGVLNGTTDVWDYYGSVYLQAANTFTGTLTVQGDSSYGLTSYSSGAGGYGYGAGNSGWRTGQLLGVAFYTLASGSAIGDAGGNVKLIGGTLEEVGSVATASAAFPGKNDLSYSGMCIVGVKGTAADNAQITFNSLTRANGNSTLVIAPENNSLGANEKVLVNTGTAAFIDSNGIVKPYIVAAYGDNTGDFLTYDPATGFNKVASYTDLPASGGVSTTMYSTAGVTLSGDVSAWDLKVSGSIGGSSTLTLGGGGLIYTTSASGVTISPNLKAGDGTGELVFYNTSYLNSGYGNWLRLNGTISAGHLTFAGPGITMLMGGDNTGALTGDTTVNQGGLGVGNDSQLGALANNLILNGGTLFASPNANGSNGNLSLHHNIEIGPAGGFIWGGFGNVNIYSVISDLDPAHPGRLVFDANQISLYGTATNTGGTYLDGNAAVRIQNGGAFGPGPIEIAGQLSANNSGAGMNLLIDTTTGNTADMHLSRLILGPLATVQLEAGGGVSFGSLTGDGTFLFATGASGNPVLTTGGDNTNADFYGDFTNDEYGVNAPGSLVKNGTGTQTLWGRIGYYGATTINGGALTINGIITGMADNPVKSGQSSDVTVNNTGTLNGAGTIDRNITVNAGGTMGGSLAITGNVTSAGTINAAGTINGNLAANGGTVAGTTTVNGSVTVAGAAVTGLHAISGDLTVSGGSFTADAGTTIGGALNVSGTGSLAGSTVVAGAAEMDGGAISGTHTIDGNYTQNGGAFSGTSTFGTVGSPVAVTINGGSFSGNHTINGSFTTTVGSYATVAPHNGATAGTLTVGGDVTLDQTTTLNFNLGQVGTVGGGVNDLIAITGDLSLDGTLNVTALTNFGPGTYTLFTYTGALTEPNGNLTKGTMPTLYTYTFSNGTTGSLNNLNLTVASTFLTGDVNGDGVANSLDIDAIYKDFSPGFVWPPRPADVNGDGYINQLDVTYELHTIFGTNYADANLDKKTDFVDFQILLDHWQASGPNIGWAQGDFDGSGTVDFLDFQKLLDYWNPGGWHFAAAQAPEPATLSLLLLGGLALLRRRN